MHEAELVWRGREAFARRAWPDAFESLSLADEAAALGAEDLELLATSAYMLGRDDEHVRALERAHHAHLDAGDTPRAVYCAYWIGHNLMLRGAMGPAAGWFGRGERLLEREGRDCAERGYLLIPALVRYAVAGDHVAAYETATEIAEIGARFANRDLIAIGVHEQGHALVRQGRFEEGLRLLDEVMVAVTAGELSLVVSGIVYCNTIGFWQSVYEVRRAREWTEALTRWCEQQPGMVAHTGVCLVHRAEIMQMQGAWDAALEEAKRAAERFADGVLNARVCGKAYYRQGEVHRLRGERSAAEESYREASRRGYEPQPGLALLRLAEGKGDAASSVIRRVLDEASLTRARAALLPAYAEIMLAGRNFEQARSACRELDTISRAHRSDMLRAMSAQARGALALAEGDPQTALAALREAWQTWQELEAPYEAARVRVLLGLGCRAVGDEGTAAWELDAARGVFDRLGARPDVAQVDSLTDPQTGAHGLTQRELQVLRLVARGATNRSIAGESFSATGRSTGTSATSSRSCAFRRAPRPPRTPTSTTSSNSHGGGSTHAPVWGELGCSSEARTGAPGAEWWDNWSRGGIANRKESPCSSSLSTGSRTPLASGP
jgi:DNA-binding NarL/FixJ family response regulator